MSQEFSAWMQDVIYYVLMAKMAEPPFKGDGTDGPTIIREMRANDIHFDSMFEIGMEPYEVPDEIKSPHSFYKTKR